MSGSPHTADGFDAFDRLAMARALELAARGLATTHPNPRVGCVIAQGSSIIGEGWHERAGGPHAEVEALRAAGAAAHGATAYVTLEPCNHHGRTPPCTEALIAARVARVVYAHADPDPRVSGGGAQRLRAAGIRTEEGLLAQAARELNRGFIQRQLAGRPWLRCKLAMSLDGRTALADGTSQWITGESALRDVQAWRARSSGLMTGIGTVLADDPRLSVRSPEGEARGRQPLRIVLDRRLRTPPAARLLGGGSTLIFCAAEPSPAFAARRAALEARGARVECVAPGEGGLDLGAVAAALGAAGQNEVQLEAGPTLSGALLSAGLVDELLLYVAPMLLGADARPLAVLPALTALDVAHRFSLVDTQTLGADLCLRLRPVLKE